MSKESTIEELSKYQLRVLTRLANGKSKVYAAFTGMPGDEEEETANQCFNEICRLVEMRLAVDISDDPRWSDIIREHAERGQQVIIINITNRGGWMFERTKHDKWTN